MSMGAQERRCPRMSCMPWAHGWRTHAAQERRCPGRPVEFALVIYTFRLFSVDRNLLLQYLHFRHPWRSKFRSVALLWQSTINIPRWEWFWVIQWKISLR